MLNIYLARHGQDADNAAHILNGRRNMPLTGIGVQQGRILAEEIKGLGITFDAVYGSPLIRAYRTAAMITDELGLEKPTVMDDLIEREFGFMTGKPVSQIRSLCAPDILVGDPIVYFLSGEGVETFPKTLERAGFVITEVKARHQDGDVLLVTHGDIGKMIYAAYHHLDWKAVLTGFHFGNSEMLLLSPDTPPESAHVFQVQQYNH